MASEVERIRMGQFYTGKLLQLDHDFPLFFRAEKSIEAIDDLLCMEGISFPKSLKEKVGFMKRKWQQVATPQGTNILFAGFDQGDASITMPFSRALGTIELARRVQNEALKPHSFRIAGINSTLRRIFAFSYNVQSGNKLEDITISLSQTDYRYLQELDQEIPHAARRLTITLPTKQNALYETAGIITSAMDRQVYRYADTEQHRALAIHLQGERLQYGQYLPRNMEPRIQEMLFDEAGYYAIPGGDALLVGFNPLKVGGRERDRWHMQVPISLQRTLL